MPKITVNGLDLHVVVEGDGLPVVLLHGFPDSAALWRHQLPALVAAGHRVVAPDLRGFGASARPTDVDAYRMGVLVGDVLGILDRLGIERAAVVGHDWGAGLGWTLASLVPERVTRFAALSVGHASGYLSSMRQRQLSWYMLWFLFEGVAEEALPRDDWALLREWLGSPVDLDRYVVDLARPGALTAALNWYRANITPGSFGRPPSLPPVRCPVLGVWGEDDVACGEEQMVGSQAHVAGPWRYERVAAAGHWIPLDAPNVVSALLVEFLAGQQAG
ncbi:MAG: alpha/beta fold hydrolase [Pseudonocardia sp.]